MIKINSFIKKWESEQKKQIVSDKLMDVDKERIVNVMEYYESERRKRVQKKLGENEYLKLVGEVEEVSVDLVEDMTQRLLKSGCNDPGVHSCLEAVLYLVLESPAHIQKRLFHFFQEQLQVLDKLWHSLCLNLQMVLAKLTPDKVLQLTFKRVQLLLQFHQFLAQDNQPFKHFCSSSPISSSSSSSSLL